MHAWATWALASFGAGGLPFALQLTKSKNADDELRVEGQLHERVDCSRVLRGRLENASRVRP